MRQITGKVGLKSKNRTRKPIRSKEASRRRLANVYDYSSTKSDRRSRVDSSLSKDEKNGFASEDEDEDEEAATMRKRLVNLVQGEDVAIASEEDEEIESDEAFEASDEERFAEFTFGHKVCSA
jgi:U3 small nucleolar RNA-associated protein 14